MASQLLIADLSGRNGTNAPSAAARPGLAWAPAGAMAGSAGHRESWTSAAGRAAAAALTTLCRGRPADKRSFSVHAGTCHGLDVPADLAGRGQTQRIWVAAGKYREGRRSRTVRRSVFGGLPAPREDARHQASARGRPRPWARQRLHLPGAGRAPGPGSASTSPGPSGWPHAEQLTTGVKTCPQLRCLNRRGGPPSGVAHRSPQAVKTISTGISARPASVSTYRNRGGRSL